MGSDPQVEKLEGASPPDENEALLDLRHVSQRTRPKGRMAAGLLLLIFYQIKIKVTKNSCICNSRCNPETLGRGCKFHTTALLTCPNDEMEPFKILAFLSSFRL